MALQTPSSTKIHHSSKATSGSCSMGFPAYAHPSLLTDAWRFATQTTQPGKAMLRTPELINSASILNEDPPPRRRRRVVPVAWAFQPVLTAACLRMHGDSQHKPHSLERLCHGRQNSSISHPSSTKTHHPSKATSGGCSIGFPACAHCSLLADAWRFATQTTQPGKAMLRTPELIKISCSHWFISADLHQRPIAEPGKQQVIECGELLLVKGVAAVDDDVSAGC